MGKHNALISGSFALQFFERVTWPKSDLDLFVEQGPGYESLCGYLVQMEKYKMLKSEDNTVYEKIDLLEVIQLS